MKYIINKILTEEGIKLTINNNKQDIDSIDTVRVYSAWDWLKHKHDDDNHYQIPQYESKIAREVTLTICPDECTPTFIIIEIDIKLKDSSDIVSIHTMFINELSLFKAKGIYLEGLAKDNCGNGCGSFCNNCAEYKDLLGLMTFMLRLSLFKDAYIYNNETLALEYYKDLQRYVNLDKIPFTYIDTNKSEYNTPDKLHDLYHYLNHELKHNISPCAKKVFESLMLKDLYDLLFSVTNKGGKGNWILDDHIWNMYDEFWYDNKIWKD